MLPQVAVSARNNISRMVKADIDFPCALVNSDSAAGIRFSSIRQQLETTMRRVRLVLICNFTRESLSIKPRRFQIVLLENVMPDAGRASYSTFIARVYSTYLLSRLLRTGNRISGGSCRVPSNFLRSRAPRL